MHIVVFNQPNIIRNVRCSRWSKKVKYILNFVFPFYRFTSLSLSSETQRLGAGRTLADMHIEVQLTTWTFISTPTHNTANTLQSLPTPTNCNPEWSAVSTRLVVCQLCPSLDLDSFVYFVQSLQCDSSSCTELVATIVIPCWDTMEAGFCVISCRLRGEIKEAWPSLTFKEKRREYTDIY